MNKKEETGNKDNPVPEPETKPKQEKDHACCGMKMRKIKLPDGSETFV